MIRLRKYMHFWVGAIIYGLLMVTVYGSTPTVTRTKDGNIRNKFNVYKNTYTSTTGKDTVLVLDDSGNAFEVGDLMSQSDKLITLQFQSAEGLEEWEGIRDIGAQNLNIVGMEGIETKI